MAWLKYAIGLKKVTPFYVARRKTRRENRMGRNHIGKRSNVGFMLIIQMVAHFLFKNVVLLTEMKISKYFKLSMDNKKKKKGYRTFYDGSINYFSNYLPKIFH